MKYAFRPRRQTGLVTLAVSIMTLAIASAVVIYAYSSTISEISQQQNSLKTLYARNAAEAGVEYAIAALNNSPTTYLNTDGSIKQSTIQLTVPSVTVGATTTDPKLRFEAVLSRVNTSSPIQIVSTGGYNCGAASNVSSSQLAASCDANSKVQVLINLTTATSTGYPGVSDALMTLGDAVFSGSSCIQGGGDGNAVHSGGTITRGNTFSGSDCTDNNGKGVYGDSFMNDGNLKSLEGNNTLAAEAIYGQTAADLCKDNLYKKGQGGVSYDGDHKVITSGKLDPANFQTPGVYCLKGDVTLGGSGNDTFGLPGAGQGVVIYVEGTITMNGNAHIYGIVHGTGSITQASGNVTIDGSLISNGSFNSSGNIKVRFNGEATTPSCTSGCSADNNYRIVSGSWKDW